jgi:hypothetical protein
VLSSQGPLVGMSLVKGLAATGDQTALGKRNANDLSGAVQVSEAASSRAGASPLPVVGRPPCAGPHKATVCTPTTYVISGR